MLSQDEPGFVVNRILLPMINEAVFVLGQSTAGIEDIDKGLPAGAQPPDGAVAARRFRRARHLASTSSRCSTRPPATAKYRPRAAASEICRGRLAGPQDRARFLRLYRRSAGPNPLRGARAADYCGSTVTTREVMTGTASGGGRCTRTILARYERSRRIGNNRTADPGRRVRTDGRSQTGFCEGWAGTGVSSGSTSGANSPNTGASVPPQPLSGSSGASATSSLRSFGETARIFHDSFALLRIGVDRAVKHAAAILRPDHHHRADDGYSGKGERGLAVFEQGSRHARTNSPSLVKLWWKSARLRGQAALPFVEQIERLARGQRVKIDGVQG